MGMILVGLGSRDRVGMRVFGEHACIRVGMHNADAYADAYGDVDGDVCGDACGDVCGDVYGDVCGDAYESDMADGLMRVAIAHHSPPSSGQKRKFENQMP